MGSPSSLIQIRPRKVEPNETSQPGNEDTNSYPESQIDRDHLVEELVEELRDRVAFLERALERREIEAERYQQIVAGLTQTNNQVATRLRELEAPRGASEATEPLEAHTVASEEPERVEPRPSTGEPQEPAQEERPSWWRRMFGR